MPRHFIKSAFDTFIYELDDECLPRCRAISISGSDASWPMFSSQWHEPAQECREIVSGSLFAGRMRELLSCIYILWFTVMHAAGGTPQPCAWYCVIGASFITIFHSRQVGWRFQRWLADSSTRKVRRHADRYWRRALTTFSTMSLLAI